MPMRTLKQAHMREVIEHSVCDSSSTTAGSDEHRKWPIYVMLFSILVAKAVPAKEAG